MNRVLALSCFTLLPFAAYLLSSRYPLARPEALAALALLALYTLLLAAILRNERIFLAFYSLALSALAAAPLTRTFHLAVNPWLVFAATLALTLTLAARLGPRLCSIVTSGALAMLAVHAVIHLVPTHATANTAHAPASAPLPHVLFLILDEHSGLAALPPETAARLEDLYVRSGFTLYPNAHSNYPATLDSIPSMLNGALAARRHQFIHGRKPDAYGIYHVECAAFFDPFRQTGLAIDITQFQAISFAAARPDRLTEYTDSLAPLAPLDIGWTEKLQLLTARYQASDPVFQRFKGLLPFRFRDQLMLPISVASWWPSHLFDSIRSARRPTLFFAHIALPHGPYLFREDGTPRPLAEWSRDQAYARVPHAEYEARRARYSAQILFTAHQVRTLLDRLRSAGLLDPLTVVILSDHASRNRLLRPEAPVALPSDRYDYVAQPPAADLNDRFSILFAFKPPHSTRGRVDAARLSALQLLAAHVTGRALPPGPRAMFLFDENDNPRKVAFP